MIRCATPLKDNERQAALRNRLQVISPAQSQFDTLYRDRRSPALTTTSGGSSLMLAGKAAVRDANKVPE